MCAWQNSFDLACAVKCYIYEHIYGVYEPLLLVSNAFQMYRACLTPDQYTLVFSLKVCYSSTCYLTDLSECAHRNYILMIVVYAFQKTLEKKVTC